MIFLARDDIAEVKKHGKLWQLKWRSFFRCLGSKCVILGQALHNAQCSPHLKVHAFQRQITRMGENFGF